MIGSIGGFFFYLSDSKEVSVEKLIPKKEKVSYGVFDMNVKGNIAKAAQDSSIGTLITNDL